MKSIIALLALLVSLAVLSCGPIPEDTAYQPLNTPGDGRYVSYTDTDIHWRMFAADYGHYVKEETPLGEEVPVEEGK